MGTAIDNSTKTSGDGAALASLSEEALGELSRFRNLAEMGVENAKLDFGLPAHSYAAAAELEAAGLMSINTSPGGETMMYPTAAGREELIPLPNIESISPEAAAITLAERKEILDGAASMTHVIDNLHDRQFEYGTSRKLTATRLEDGASLYGRPLGDGVTQVTDILRFRSISSNSEHYTSRHDYYFDREGHLIRALWEERDGLTTIHGPGNDVAMFEAEPRATNLVLTIKNAIER